ncbi:MAG: YdgA family protein [Desulfobacteraceae bacterium]|nr:YdgA family protein [Desulfobacteraceae bacterium]
MKKLLAILFVLAILLAGAYCGASYWAGMQAQSQYEQMLDHVSRSYNAKAVSKSYERGVFESRALTSITLTGSPPAEPIRFSLENSIYHGPLFFEENRHVKWGVQPIQAVIRTRLAPATEDRKEFREFFEKLPELASSEFLTILHFDGSGESYLEIPPINKTLAVDGENVQVEWRGLDAKSRFDLGIGNISGSFSAPQLSITEKDNKFYLDSFHGEFESHPGLKGVVVGSGSFSVDRIGFDTSGAQVFSLKSPGFEVDSGVTGETINASLQLRFDNLLVEEENWGPLMFRFEARKLSPDGLLKMQEAARRLNERPQGMSDEDFSALFARYFKAAVTELLTKSPEFELKQMHFKTRNGDIDGKAKIVFSGTGDLPPNIFLLLNSIDAGVEVSISEPLFFDMVERRLLPAKSAGDNEGDAGDARQPEETERQVKEEARNVAKGLISEGFMVSDQGTFRSNAAYKFGKLTVNGKKIPLDELLRGAQ